MEGIPIFYVMQPSVDDTLNVFYLPPQIKTQSDVKIQDVVNNFPHKNSGKFYHYRFYALCDKDQKTWVDISNLGAKAPVVDNKILVKILELAQPQYSKIFSSLYTGKSNTSVPNGAQQRAPEQPQSQQQRPAPQQNTQQRQQPQPTPQQQTQNRPAPQQNTQQNTQQRQAPPANNPKPQAADDFDLLGGFGGPSTSSANVNISQTTTTTKTSVNFSSPPQEKKDNSALYNMTRDELAAHKQREMDQAIQDKLDFAKKVWEDEEKNKEEKHLAYAELEDMIKKWAGKDKQRNNIRALLCTLQDVVWPESGWAPLSFSDLMQPAQIKKNYFKAITRFHPDKNQHAEFKHKYISERVTNELNAAWDEHRKTNP